MPAIVGSQPVIQPGFLAFVFISVFKSRSVLARYICHPLLQYKLP
jgi:hypothetical protein